jgi:hypothetical protein
MCESRHIATCRKSHLDRMISPLGLIVLRKSFPKPVCLDPRNRVLAGIEYGLGAAKDIGCDVVFVKLVCLSRKGLLPHVLKQMAQSWPPGQCSYNTLQFGALCFVGLGVGIQTHHHNLKKDSCPILRETS